MDHDEIFNEYERLVHVTIEGREFNVPENNSILRCLQYLDMDGVSLAELCWNGDCLDCRVTVKNTAGEKRVLACRADIEEGMTISDISPQICFDPAAASDERRS
jgi:predicted molibdopterin-dependent oxidoreductase YjgC